MSEAHDIEASFDQLTGELIEIREEMRRAFEHGRWQDLADLDIACRSSVSRIVATKDRELFALLTETLNFYRTLLSEFHAQKDDISSEVLQLRRAQSSNRVYRQMSVVR